MKQRMHVGGCIAVSTRARRRAEEKARDMGWRYSFAGGSLRKRFRWGSRRLVVGCRAAATF